MRAVVFTLLLLPIPAVAQDQTCFDGTQQNMNACTYAEWEAADADLNRVYAEVLATLQDSDANFPPDGNSEEDRLRTAQRAWVAFRDANCDLAGYPMRGGSAEPLLTYGCMRQMTEERSTELQALVQGY